MVTVPDLTTLSLEELSALTADELSELLSEPIGDIVADEVQVRSSLQILKKTGEFTLIDYRSQPTVFKTDITGVKGPLPGAVAVSTAGIEIDLSQLTVPGFCRLMNQDGTNYVTYGILDADGNTFHALGELGPGESYVLKLARDIGLGTGTGYESLFIKADTASCNVLVEAFER